MKITPSQTLFSFWRDICGGTPLFVSVNISGLKLDKDRILIAYNNLCRKHPILVIQHFPGNEGYASDKMMLASSNPFESQTIGDTLFITEVNEKQVCTVLDTFKQQSLRLMLGQITTASHRVLVTLCNGEVRSVTVAVEHFFVDGLGCDQILADLVSLLHAPDSTENGDNLDEFGSASRILIEQYCTAFAELPTTDPYLQEFIGARTLYLGVQPHSIRVQASKSDYRSLTVRIPKSRLSDHAKTNGMTEGFSQFSHLLACFENALQVADPQLKELVIQVATHGRVLPSVKLPREIVGCFASAMPYRFHFVDQTPINKQALAHEQRIRPLIARHIDQISANGNQNALFKNRDLRAKLANDSFASAVRLGAVSNIYFSFFGTSAVDRLSCDSKMHGLDFGTTNLPGSLDVMLINVGDELVASFNFDVCYFDKTYIEKLSSAFASAIVVDFTASYPNCEALPHIDQIAIEDEVANCISNILSKVAVRRVYPHELETELDIAFDLGIDSLGRTIVADELSQQLNVRLGQRASERLFACSKLREFIAIFVNERGM